jgi:hypothetical protein
LKSFLKFGGIDVKTRRRLFLEGFFYVGGTVLIASRGNFVASSIVGLCSGLLLVLWKMRRVRRRRVEI